MKYASIVPLIGGETIAMEKVFGQRPEYMLSYEAFQNNDQHIVKYYNDEVPYHILEGTDSDKAYPYVDVVNTVCPCAGLSSLGTTSSSTNEKNDWMYTTSEYVLSKISPKVFWGENAPRLAAKMGEPVVNRLREIGEKYGYTFSLYKTKSILHGLPQVRTRTFYFFWKDNQVPLLPYYKKEYEKIETFLQNVELKEDDPMAQVITNQKKPSDNPLYKFVLEVIEGGISHKEYAEKISKTVCLYNEIENAGWTFDKVGEWMRENGYELVANRCERIHKKLSSGGGIMRRDTEIPKDYTGAFVGHLPVLLAHPIEDRYLTIRECLSIMKMPEDFQLQGGLKNLNHICQNVPVTTAMDMASGIRQYLDGALDYVNSKYVVQDNYRQKHEAEYEAHSLDEFI